MHFKGYSVIMIQNIYMFAQEEDDAGTAGVLMSGAYSYRSGLLQLLSGVYCDSGDSGQ